MQQARRALYAVADQQAAEIKKDLDHELSSQ
jgi:hypothetical protein